MSSRRTTLIALVGNVRQQRHLACALHCYCNLPLVAAAGAGDPARADLALLGDVPPQLVEVLVVDLVDLLLAEVAGPAPAGRRHRRAPAPALLLLLSVAGSGHQQRLRTGCRRRLRLRPYR